MGWLAYWQVEPFGNEWRQTATIAWAASLTANWKKGHRPDIDKFLPVKTPKKRMTNEQIQASFDAFFGMQKTMAEEAKRRRGQ